MGIFNGKATSKGSNGEEYELPPADNQPAALVAIVDLGTQTVQKYGGDGIDQKRQVYLVWELVDAKLSGTTNNHLIGQVYTLSFHEKASLRLMVESWRGTKYNDGDAIQIEQLLGHGCLLNVIHGTSKNSGKAFAKIAAKGVTKLPKGMKAARPGRTPFLFELEAEDGTLRDYRELPDWLPFIYGEPVRDVVSRAGEFKRATVASKVAPAGGGDAEEEMPF